MKLMIVESPNKIKKIKAILGCGWDVAASVGHIRDLPVKSLGIEPNTYRLEYQILERSESVVAQLRQRAARSEQVYLATDPDREGEAIAWHLQQVLNLRRYTGDNAAQAAERHGVRLEVVKHTEVKRGYVLLPRRWVVERSFAWAPASDDWPETTRGVQRPWPVSTTWPSPSSCSQIWPDHSRKVNNRLLGNGFLGCGKTRYLGQDWHSSYLRG
jgi:Toprim domain